MRSSPTAPQGIAHHHPHHHKLQGFTHPHSSRQAHKSHLLHITRHTHHLRFIQLCSLIVILLNYFILQPLHVSTCTCTCINTHTYIHVYTYMYTYNIIFTFSSPALQLSPALRRASVATVPVGIQHSFPSHHPFTYPETTPLHTTKPHPLLSSSVSLSSLGKYGIYTNLSTKALHVYFLSYQFSGCFGDSIVYSIFRRYTVSWKDGWKRRLERFSQVSCS